MASPELDAGPAWDAYWWCKANVLEEAECEFFLIESCIRSPMHHMTNHKRKKDK